MERLTTGMQHRPALLTIINFHYYYVDQSCYQQLVYIAIALTTLQIRRLLWDDVESVNVCIVRCSIYPYSCAPAIVNWY